MSKVLGTNEIVALGNAIIAVNRKYIELQVKAEANVSGDDLPNFTKDEQKIWKYLGVQFPLFCKNALMAFACEHDNGIMTDAEKEAYGSEVDDIFNEVFASFRDYVVEVELEGIGKAFAFWFNAMEDYANAFNYANAGEYENALESIGSFIFSMEIEQENKQESKRNFYNAGIFNHALDLKETWGRMV